MPRLTLDSMRFGSNGWVRIARRANEWAAAGGVASKDIVVLVPYLQVLAEARRAFAATGAWMPRVETTRTLAAALGPPARAEARQVTFDPALDALAAAGLMRGQAWGAAWARRDARGFEQAVEAVVATAHELLRAASAVPPAEREAHWAAARESLAPRTGPGASERLLARVALEWASLAPPPVTDRLFDALAPRGWVVVQAGGAGALSQRLLAESSVPCLLIDTDPPHDEPFAAFAASAESGTDAARPPVFALCDGFEDEAQCTAAQVLAHVSRGEVPVALIAQDRALIRRVRALLDRHGLRLLDETGWKLSTTRAAALVMSLLRAAQDDATTDALLDWLKAGTEDDAALGALEAACRRAQAARSGDLVALDLEPRAARLRSAAAAVLMPLANASRQPLVAWSSDLTAALAASGAWPVLQADDAGRQVIAALKLEPGSSLPGSSLPTSSIASAWALGAAAASMNRAEFERWVASVLEQATFRPHAGFDGTPDVVVTPLAEAMLRSFAAVVLPGADDTHLGASHASASLLDDTQAVALGVPTRAERRRAELLAFAQVLQVPHLTLLRRRIDGADPLADSPLVERLSMALAAHGRTFGAWHDPRREVDVPPSPVHMTAPSAAALLPARMSASACEALRACPYRFFALNMLGLREEDELEREVEKRDYGTWLHAVLYDFHHDREAPADAPSEVERLMRLARNRLMTEGTADADFLPFSASFESFAPRYVAWLHGRDAEGAIWVGGEEEIVLEDAALGGTTLRGIVDRIDEREAGRVVELIDYKTGSAAALKEKVRQPLEDTQLAFYAALMRSRTERPLQARYLALDGTKRLEEVEHPEVEASAAALVEGLAEDLRRIRAGAGLPALGVGSTCTHCAARGVCRRDHWAEGGA